MIGIAVVGAGQWGPNLIRNFHEHPSSSVRAIVDHDAEKLRRASQRYAGVPTASDLSEVLHDESIDACVIATPTSTHFELTRSALSFGKHVLVEKPLTTSVADCEELCKLAEDAHLVLMVGHVFVYNDAIVRVKDYLHDGSIGRLYYISMLRTNLGPIRVDVNAAWDLAAHDIAIANWWLGAEPLSVSAIGGSWINEGLADAVFASLRYPDGVLVKIDVSWLNPRKVRQITIVGDKRMLTVDDMELNEPVRIYDKGVRDERFVPDFVDTFASFRASTREGDITVPRISMSEPLRSECDHFIECIRDGKRPRSGGRDGLGVVRVLEAIDRSMSAAGRETAV